MSRSLVLHVEIPSADLYADDAQEAADEFYKGDVGRLVLEEWLREEVGITLVFLPGDKCMNDEFGVNAYVGKIIGAETKGDDDE